jgi:tetratricopeptide (TPR) repeat protein
MMSMGNVNLAVPQFRAVVQRRPEDAEPHYRLGHCYRRQGKWEEAVASYREALRLRPGWPDASNDLAWLLATCPEDAVRDPVEALRLAWWGFESSQRLGPMFLDSVAAAHAAAGDFPEAAKAQRQAMDMAAATGDEKLLAELEKRRKLYAEGKPYREHVTAKVPALQDAAPPENASPGRPSPGSLSPGSPSAGSSSPGAR